MMHFGNGDKPNSDVTDVVFQLSEVHAAWRLRTTVGEQTILWCHLCCWQGTVSLPFVISK